MPSAPPLVAEIATINANDIVAEAARRRAEEQRQRDIDKKLEEEKHARNVRIVKDRFRPFFVQVLEKMHAAGAEEKAFRYKHAGASDDLLLESMRGVAAESNFSTVDVAVKICAHREWIADEEAGGGVWSNYKAKVESVSYCTIS